MIYILVVLYNKSLYTSYTLKGILESSHILQNANAQTTKQPVKPVAVKPTAVKAPVSVLKNLNDSASYAVGVSVANF